MTKRTVARAGNYLSSHRAIVLAVASAVALPTVVLPSVALADLRVCNFTSSRVGLAIGYQDPKTSTPTEPRFATEGWWTIGGGGNCETLIRGPVPGRFIYVHAIDYDRSGEWGGANQMCTADRTFAIIDVKDCQKRGYKASGFFEVDTGDAKEWTIRLSDPDPQGAKSK
jgi:uncharacterized membrane protein